MIYSTQSFGILGFIFIYLITSIKLQRDFRKQQKVCKKNIFKAESKIKSIKYDTLYGGRVIRAYSKERYISLEMIKQLEEYENYEIEKALVTFDLNCKLTILSALMMIPSIYLFVS